jgi:CRP-like cAMP-binding protein
MSADALQHSALAPLLAVARDISFAKGARLVRQGEAARGAFLIRAGEAEAQVSLPGGGTLSVASFSTGAMFGEMALVEKGVCSATVLALSTVEACFVGRDDFRAMVASRDARALEVQRAITRTLAARLRALNAKVREHPAQEDRPAREAPPAGDPLAKVKRSDRAAYDWKAFQPLLPFFEGFDGDEAEDLLAAARVLELPRGAWLFAQGLPAPACYLVLRGAAEVFTRSQGKERRVAIAGPGELVGYMAALDGAAHGGNARVREAATLLELSRESLLAVYDGTSAASVSLQHAIQRSLLRALTRTNTLLTRLISHERLAKAGAKAEELETVLHAQIWRAQQS